MKTCPCCGRPMLDEVTDAIASVHLSPAQERIALRLARQFGRWVRCRDLIEAVYWDAADGGPLNVGNVISVQVYYLTRRLASAGLKVEGVTGRGGGRRLVWAAPERVAA